jgi:paraquat-inducible protein B
MGSKINPTTIGAFVVGAIVLLIAGGLLFGGGKFLQEKLPYVMFFDSSVEGLNVGAPVVFRGVQVGQVTEVAAIADPTTFSIVVRVKVELVRGSIKVSGGPVKDPHEAMEGLIHKGLRATLRMQSFVTGLLYVALDFFPDTPIKRLGLDPALPELPTIPSDMDQLKSSIQQAMADLRKLPLDTILTEVLAMLKRANTLLDVPELKQALVVLYDVMTNARQLLATADSQVGALGPKVGGTAEVASKTLLDAQKLIRDIDGQVAPLAGGAKETLASAREALTAARSALGQAQKSLGTLTDAATPVLKQADKTFAGTAALTGPDSAALTDLSHTLKALEEAARAIRALANMLERNPETLIRGKSR